MENIQLLKKDEYGNPCYKYKNFDKPHIEYVSVTKVRDSVQKPFKAKEKATELSRNPDKKQYFQRDPEEIVKEWNLNGHRAAEYGTVIHNIVERHLLSTCWSFLGDDELEQRVIREFQKAMEEVTNELHEFGFEYTYDSFKTEVVHHLPIRSKKKYNGKYLTKVVINKMTEKEINEFLIDFQDEFTTDDILNTKTLISKKNLLIKLINFGLAGSVDIRFDAPKYFAIIDIKTDEEITTDSWNGRECFLYPMNNLKKCKINKYGIQTGTYGVLGTSMESLKGKQYLGKDFILHWDKMDQTFTVIKLRNYYQHARYLVGHYFKLL